MALSRNILALGVVSFLTDVSTEMIYPLLPLFLTTVLGANVLFVGLVEGVAETTASVLKLFSGWWSDRLGKRKAIFFSGYCLSTLTRPLIAVATFPWHVLVCRFLDRAGKGVRTSPRDALISSSCPEHERGKAFGFHRGMDHAGAVVGPLLAFLLLSRFNSGLRTIFWLAFIPGLLSLITIMFAVTEKGGDSMVGNPGTNFTLRGLDARFRRFLGVITLFTLGNSTDAFLILRAQSVGISLSHIPLLWMFLHITKSVSSMPGGMLSDRFGRRGTIITGWLVYALVYLGFAFATRPADIWVLFGVYGLFFGLTEGVEKALVADLVDEPRRGTAFGAYNLAIGVTTFPASLILGFLWNTFGVEIAFGFGAALSGLAALLFTVSVKEMPRTAL
ncbi:MAG: multidrug resistance protein MdtH [Syntrophorhabdus sp. PtaU1.Bin002]|nr:MAG: multidrug resistance protein MdtH [Syntrophorhabdus sp. PtaU1.Bin002]